MKSKLALCGALVGLFAANNALAVTSAEIYTSKGYQFGRFSARMQYASGSGVVSSFFMWKDGSERSGVFWNELDFEKLEAECRLETNTIFGDPEGLDPEKHTLSIDLCKEYHVYTYEWTPDYIAWLIDGVEIRRDEGETAVAFRDNTPSGMQLRFNVWPGDATFGGEFDPAILPVYEYIDWVEYSSYTEGAFKFEWREDFTGSSLPSGWLTGSWDSPKGLSTHSPDNVGLIDGYVVLALTNDDATGFAAANPRATDTQAQQPAPEPTDLPPGSSAPPADTTVPADTTTPAAGTDTTTTPGAPPPSVVAEPKSDSGGGCSLGGVNAQRSPYAAILAGAALAFAAVRRRNAKRCVQSQPKVAS